jgi:hypothetical protein
MGNTPNNNFPYPEPTDLVKDGAQAIEDLADAIDTTLGVYAPVSSGLTLINTTSFSAVSSVSLPAATFSATYDNYKVIFNVDSSASSVGMTMRMRVGGVDNSSANYAYGNYGVKGQSVTASLGASGGSLATSNSLTAISGTYTTSFEVNFYKPFDSSFNTNIYNEMMFFDSTGNYEFITNKCILSVTTSYDSASFIPGSGTMTGVYFVYGFAK